MAGKEKTVMDGAEKPKNSMPGKMSVANSGKENSGEVHGVGDHSL